MDKDSFFKALDEEGIMWEGVRRWGTRPSRHETYMLYMDHRFGKRVYMSDYTIHRMDKEHVQRVLTKIKLDLLFGR